MTQRKPRTRRKRKPGRRTRTIPIQFYVSEVEHAGLETIARQRELSVSELVRRWIRRAAVRAAVGRGARKTPPEDPRQLRLA